MIEAAVYATGSEIQKQGEGGGTAAAISTPTSPVKVDVKPSEECAAKT